MNFGHLALFQAVAKASNMSRAAEELMISQPAISKQLKELERSLGVTLFDRVSKGMRLTDAGKLLQGYSRRIFALAEEARTAIDELNGIRRGKLVVGASTTIGVYLLPKIFVAFRKKYPLITLELVIANSQDIYKKLQTGEIHLGLTEGVIDELDAATSIFATDELVAIASPKHPLAKQKEISIKELVRQPFVVRETGSGTKSVVEKTLAKRNLTLSPIMSLGSTEAIKRAVASGVGIAVVSALSIQLELKAGELVRLRVPDLRLTRPLHRLRIKSHTETAAAKAFMEMI